MPFAIDNVLTARVDLPPAEVSRFRRQHPVLRAAAAEAASDARRRGGDAVRRPAGGRQRLGPACRSRARRTRRTATIRSRARASSPPATSRRSRPGAERPRVHRRPTPRRASRSRSSTSRSRGRTSRARSDRPPDQAQPSGSKEPWLTIVGVVPDLLMQGIGNNNASPVGYYIPIAQSDVANGVRIAVRTRGDPPAVTALVRSAVASLDADLAIYEVSTMRTRHRSADAGSTRSSARSSWRSASARCSSRRPGSTA